MRMNGTLIKTLPGVGLKRELLFNMETGLYESAPILKENLQGVLFNLIDENTKKEEILQSISIAKATQTTLVDAVGNRNLEEDLNATLQILHTLSTAYKQVWYYAVILQYKLGYFIPLPYFSMSFEDTET